MASNILSIDASTVVDDLAQRRVIFDAEVNGTRLRFAVTYDVLEHISGDIPGTSGQAMFEAYSSRVQSMAAAKVAQGNLLPINVISSRDL